MTIDSWLRQATTRLHKAGIQTARLDCLVILEDSLRTDRTHLLAEPDSKLTIEQLNELDRLITERTQHIPLAYLRQKAEFYGREFMVNSKTLVPRPESESIIALLQTINFSPRPNIADVGCGSGCLGITAALLYPTAAVWLTDISSGALQVARHNAEMHKTTIHFSKQNLLEGLDEQFDVLLCNLPYVPANYAINQAATHEPPLALFGGPDGLQLYRELFAQAAQKRLPPRWIITEALLDQHQHLATIAAKSNYSLQANDGLAQCFSYEG